MSENTLENARILVVDDEVSNLKLMERMLTNQGCEFVTTISDPREVAARIENERFDLILLDLNMPRLDGYQVMEQVSKLDVQVLPPIIVLTAQHGKDFLLRALSMGARDYITKPFDRNELIMRVRNQLEAHLAHQFLNAQKEVLENMVRARTEELWQSRLQVVQRLGRVAEYRDEETGSHIMRMSHICQLLAREIGWDDEQCDLVLNASPLHDIGKVGIPDAILLKPGKLDAQEWEVMKTHTNIGAKMLEGDDSALIMMARDISISHHEKWDGSGYPNGLANDEIPLAGRMAAVADVFDALTSERVYKKAWSLEETMALIRENSGKQFDPQLVEVLSDNLSEVLEIKDRYRDDEVSDR